MARRTRSERQQSGVHAMRKLAAQSSLDAQLQPLYLELHLPPQAPPQSRAEAASETVSERKEGSCVIVIDLA